MSSVFYSNIEFFVDSDLCLYPWLPCFQIQLVLGRESSIGVGWRREDKKMSSSGEVKVCMSVFFPLIEHSQLIP